MIRIGRLWQAAVLGGICALLASVVKAESTPPAASGRNLALIAKPSTSYVSGHEKLQALNSGHDPANSNDKSHGAYGNWPRTGMQWVQYEWSQPVAAAKMDIYWFDDKNGVRLPVACRLLYWDGAAFVPVREAAGLGLEGDKYNTTTFPEVRTAKFRLEFDSRDKTSTGLLQWKVYDSGHSPNFAPVVKAGIDRVVVLKQKTYLNGRAEDDGKANAKPKLVWSQESGPGKAVFADAAAATTTATFSKTGTYVLKLTADDGELKASDTLTVAVEDAPPAKHLYAVNTTPYALNSTLLWNDRAKKLIVNWIPHCYDKLSDPALPEGGIGNFIQAGNKLAGRPVKAHPGAPWSNAYVHNIVESMCIGLMIDPQGDAEIIAAQKAYRAKLDEWLPIILAAQEPDGYLNTANTTSGHKRWTDKTAHEGYVAGYFIESAIAHYTLTGGQDRRLYDAAKKLADCWCANIGPAPKKKWFDGHQEMEQALVRFAGFVESVEGPGKGRQYVELAKFLLDSRGGGEEYDQSHLPAVQQYEAVGHAVRAVYSYSGMVGVAMESGDLDYHSAAKSLWDNLVNRKYYVTGGVGSGETSEGFGGDYSLGNNAYCESCSSCGFLFLQNKMAMIYHEAKYADAAEETLYNAILGNIDLEGKNFTYTNPLDSGHARYPWHGCPCCVGNISRTLLMLPTWMYQKGEDEICINQFIGSKVAVGKVAGTELEMVQATDYPRDGKVAITVNPAEAKRFTVRIRQPNRQVSKLYTETPAVADTMTVMLNGKKIKPDIENGYAVISRKWQAGDKIELTLPLAVQRVKADPRIAADVGRVALRYGPLIYCIEGVDQNLDQVLKPDSPLATEWKPDLLGGTLVIKGTFANGTPLTAIPYYLRNNRGGRAIVWMKDQ